MSWLQTVEMIRILKKQHEAKCCWEYTGQEVLICTYWSKKFNCSSHIVTHIYGCTLWRHSYQDSIRKLTVSSSNTFKHLINVPRYTSSSLAFAMNSTDHIYVVFRKFAYSMMSRVTASPNSIVSAIVNSDAYHKSPHCLSIRQCVLNDFIIN